MLHPTAPNSAIQLLWTRLRLLVGSTPAMLTGKYPVEKVLDFSDAVEHPSFARMAVRMRQDSQGAALMRERERVVIAPEQLELLRTLPSSSFGHNVWLHFLTNELTSDYDLADRPQLGNPDTEWTKLRYRETHDFRHVALGLGATFRDEVALHSFQLGQHWCRISVLTLLIGFVRHGWQGPGLAALLRVTRLGYRRGKSAPFLLNVDWESHFDSPIAELRKKLGISPLGDGYPGAPTPI
jgi:ubiquinone biosynthesis protein COQ4